MTLGRTARGFTLIEIMVVVIVLAIVAGAVVPNLGGTLETTRIDAAARRIGELLEFCRQSASSSGRVHGLVFKADGSKYQVVSEKPPEEGDAEDGPSLEPVTLPGSLDSALPEGVSLTSIDLREDSQAMDEEGGLHLLFFPDGTAEFATLHLTAASGDKRTVELNGLSGVVTVANPRLAGEESETEEGRETESEKKPVSPAGGGGAAHPASAPEAIL